MCKMTKKNMSQQIIKQAKKIRRNHCKNLIPRSKLLKLLLIKGRLIYTGTMKFSFAKFFNEFSVILKYFIILLIVELYYLKQKLFKILQGI